MWRSLFGSASCRLGTVLLLAGVLAGCDWDASSGQSGSRAAIGSDRTPPVVRATDPANGSEGVARARAITAEFNEDIFATTVNDDSFTIKRSVDGSRHSGVVSFDANTNTATFSSSSPLAMFETYTATLSTAITDLSGNALAEEHSWSFTSGDGEWQTPEPIENDNNGRAGSARTPQIALDAAGRALAVWAQFEIARDKIWANRFDGSEWGTAKVIESGSGGPASAPQIALNAHGQGISVWQQSNGSRNIIWASRFDGSEWEAAEEIQTDLTRDARAPQVAINSDGQAVAVWEQFNGSGYDIVANRFDGGEWGAVAESIGPAIDDDDAGNAFGPQVVLDADGQSHAVWAQFEASRYRIWSNLFDGSDWGEANPLENNSAGSASAPQIALDAGGHGLAIWVQSDGTGDHLWWSRFDGSGWGEAKPVDTESAGDASAPQIAINPDGQALAVWEQVNGSDYDIVASRFESGEWGEVESIVPDDAGSVGSPQIAVDADGRALAVWAQFKDARYQIWANRFDGSDWGEAEPIADNSGVSAPAPQVALNAEGQAFAVWQLDDGSLIDIRASRFE
ncbi:Ig-like domain-containing protein [Marinobacter sediminum]|uniref:Ig-like domain-containing protein n=1 Tax=Marinobacter sediminum TaxID=256323 RepID=UPI001EED3C7E|nr:Ig-like domain-containing protein [Marinobacter sediminum]